MGWHMDSVGLPLQAASANGHIDAVRVLLDNGAPIGPGDWLERSSEVAETKGK